MKTKEEKKAYDKKYYSQNKDKFKQYREIHIVKIKLYMKKYYLDNKEAFKSYMKEYQLKNKEKQRNYRNKYGKKPEVKAKKREYRKVNKDKINAREKKYGEINKKKVKIRRNKYRKANKDKITSNYNEYCKRRTKIDKNFAIKHRLRCSFNNSFRNYIKGIIKQKSNKYGLCWSEIVKSLKPFPKEINQYHIDHIKPLCSFQFISDDGKLNLVEIKKAWSEDNLQWLKIEDNLRKGSNYS